MDEILGAQCAVSPTDRDHLSALVDDWQLLADLSFSDLVLWVADREHRGLWAVAQVRPTTGPTTMPVDVVGSFQPTAESVAVDVVQFEPPGETNIHRQTLPVVRDGRVLAVVVRREPAMSTRPVSALESTYRQTSEALIAMMGRGQFPTPGAPHRVSSQILRVGDGLVRTSADGQIHWASPNALSAYRRMGLTSDLIGADIVTVTTMVADHVVSDVDVADLFAPVGAEAEIEGTGATVLFRVIGMWNAAGADGLVVLVRDVTELRKRERELVSKEATIREIHHRVKNNLQTVAALLRLQGRRSQAPEARTALREAEQRVATIAIVHEILSHSFDETVPFDEVADRLMTSVLELGGPGIHWHREGTFGAVRSEVATTLAMVITELVQNAYEHAFGAAGGNVVLRARRSGAAMFVEVCDDGAGLPEDFDPGRSLGLSIVSTLVEGELAGQLKLGPGPDGGTTVSIEFATDSGHR